MNSWQCTVCQSIYDPKVGDIEHGVDPETPFAELPDEWVCPDCGAGKDAFVEL